MKGTPFCIASFAICSLLTFAKEPPAHSQTTGTRPSFEVASIKPNPPGETRAFMTESGETFIATGETLKSLISYAYAVRDFQLFGASGWMASDRWTIEAKAPNGSIPPRSTKLNYGVPSTKALMLQSLVEDRYKLRIHRETREQMVYELSVAKGGSKLRLSKDQNPDPTVAADIPRGSGPGRTPRPGAWSSSSGRFDGTAISLGGFIVFLAPHLDGPVIDKTGLRGLYDFHLTFAQTAFAFATPDSSDAGMTGPSVFTALREQLGLQLVPKKGPVSVIVIDGAQKPTQTEKQLVIDSADSRHETTVHVAN